MPSLLDRLKRSSSIHRSMSEDEIAITGVSWQIEHARRQEEEKPHHSPSPVGTVPRNQDDNSELRTELRLLARAGIETSKRIRLFRGLAWMDQVRRNLTGSSLLSCLRGPLDDELHLAACPC